MQTTTAVTYRVLYDGSCGRCSRSVAWLRRLDRGRRLSYVDITREWERLAASTPALDREACLDAMHVIAPDSRVTAGFDAVRTLAWAVPWLWPFAPWLHLPGVAPIGRRLYRYVAQRRITSCRLEPTPPQ
jgi:predicted DCC family thiol-disulfide oxidoreductase YuxK